MDWMPIVVLILGVPIALAVWLIVRAVIAKNRIEELSQRFRILEAEIIRLKRDKESALKSEPAPAPKPQPNIIKSAPVAPPTPATTLLTAISPPRPPAVQPPPIPVAPISPRPSPVLQPKPAINWEQFMGVKGFAWVGGFALFLGVAFSEIQAKALEGGSDESVLSWIDAKAGRRSDDDCMVWNAFLMKRGWHDPAAGVQRLRERIRESGLEGKPIETFFDYIDFDEGRDPVSAKLWETAG